MATYTYCNATGGVDNRESPAEICDVGALVVLSRYYLISGVSSIDYPQYLDKVYGTDVFYSSSSSPMIWPEP